MRRLFGLALTLPFLQTLHAQDSGNLRSVPLETSLETGTFFQLDARHTGIDLVYQFPENVPFTLMTDQYSGNGVALGDVDGDGLTDIFLTHYNRGNRLYRNLGDCQFEDITDQAGVAAAGRWCAGPNFGDVDNDGDLDLLVCVFDQANLLFINDGSGVFTEAAASHGLDYRGPSVMTALADYDLDGDLDVYLVTHRMPLGPEALPPRQSREAFQRGIVKAETVNGQRRAVIQPAYQDLFAIMEKGPGRIELITAGRPDVLYRNDGNGHFTDVSEAAGIRGRDIGLAATWWDANDDGYPDLYVSNDYKGPDHFYLNQRDGTFKDVAKSALPHIPWLSMGSDFSDINRDGRMDFLATDMAATTHYQQKVSMGDMDEDLWFLNLSNPRQMMRNALFLNTGTHRFVEGAFLTGVASSDWTWSPKFGDLDNDGWEDLFITNGMSRDFMNSDLAAKMPSSWRSEAWADTPVLRQKNLAYRNTGQLKFKPVQGAWGLDQQTASYGAAYGDLDRDGDLDLVVVNFDEPVHVLRNDINQSNRLLISLRGKEVNRYGIGATVSLETAAGTQTKQLFPTRGFMSANEPVLHFGLGEDTEVQRLKVRWPLASAKQYVEFKDLNANQHLTIHEGTADLAKSAPPPHSTHISYRRVQFPSMPMRHRETPFDDYQRQPLLPLKHSQLGPGLAVGDVDGDGMDDFYLGGAAGQAGQLVRLSSTVAINTKPFEQHRASEDMGALFFDADGDSDLDLYVVSGGVECDSGSDLLADRLYLNQGDGSFDVGADHLPKTYRSGSSITAGDFDRDGDLDLFVGTRLIPGAYPASEPSQLLINDGQGRFAESEDKLDTGMVTSAVWTDLNVDGWPDLLAAEDWGTIRVWHNTEGRLQEATEELGLDRWTGWWSGLAVRDLDNDGDLDFAATNLGLNTKYKASPERPLLLFYGDFDGSGQSRMIEAGYEADVLYPKRGKSCSTNAIPALSERFRTYHDFARSSLREIYGSSLDDAVKKSVNTLQSGVFLNEGEEGFNFLPFPRLAQISPGFGIAITEINGDTYPDVYFVQNNHSPQPETGRFDSGVSQILLGKGFGQFELASYLSSPIVAGDAKGLAFMDWNRDGAPDWLVSQNNGPLLAFQHAKTSPIIAVKLQGQKWGARLEWKCGKNTQVAELQAGGSYLSQSSGAVHFGFGSEGEAAQSASLTIHWPSGKRTQHEVRPQPKVWTFTSPE